MTVHWEVMTNLEKLRPEELPGKPESHVTPVQITFPSTTAK